MHCTLINSLSVEKDEYVLAAAGKDQGRDRPPVPAKADPHGHRDLSGILVVKVRAPE